MILVLVLFADIKKNNYIIHVNGRGGSTGAGGAPPMKNVAPVSPPPHFGPASLDFHLNRPVISLIKCKNLPVYNTV